MLKVSDILLNENYEFIVNDKNDKETVWKVTMYGRFDGTDNTWTWIDITKNFADGEGQDAMNDYDAISYKYNGQLNGDAEICFYFDDENRAEEFFHKQKSHFPTHYSINGQTAKRCRKDYTIESVNSIEE